MAKLPLLLAFLTLLLSPLSHGLDLNKIGLPVNLDFQLGFKPTIAPAPGDTSQTMGLIVTPDKIYTDKQNSMNITGTITNITTTPYADVAIHFAVTSYIGTSINRGVATVTPDFIPPGATATFIAYVSLDDPKPRLASYTVTANPVVQYQTNDGIPVPYDQQTQPGTPIHYDTQFHYGLSTQP